MNAAVCTTDVVPMATVKGDEEDDERWIKRKRQNSNPYNFASGHESDSSPPDSPGFSSFGPQKQEEEPLKCSNKVSKRSRKMSLFSFSFTSKTDDRMARFWRGISQTSPFSQTELRGTKFKSAAGEGEGPGVKSSKAGALATCSRVELENKVLQEILQDTLKQQFDCVLEYKREVCDRLAKNVSQLVKRRVEVFKESASRGFKIVSLVYVGAVKDEGIAVASQALLQSETDNFTVASYRNGHLFAVAGVMTVPIEKSVACMRS